MNKKGLKKLVRRTCVLILSIVSMLSMNVSTAFAESSPSSITGKSTVAQTVYTGPSTDYVSAGSVSKSEKVYILGTESGWYHIVYNVTGTSNRKSGYVPKTKVTSITGGTPKEDNFYGGFCMSTASQTVYSCDDYSKKVNIGSISAKEGITRLYGYNSTASNGNVYSVLFIEYSTSSGPKRGYVFNPKFSYPYNTCVGKITTSTDIYFGSEKYSDKYGEAKNYKFGKAGTVYSGEYVAVIGKWQDDVYIEYNTNSGRKRGVIPTKYVKLYNSPGNFDNDVPFYESGVVDGFYDTNQKLYAGPGSSYPVIGTVPANKDSYTWIGWKENGYYIVQYLDGSTIKSGYHYGY